MFKVKKKQLIEIVVVCIIIAGVNFAKHFFINKRECSSQEYRESLDEDNGGAKAVNRYEEGCDIQSKNTSSE